MKYLSLIDSSDQEKMLLRNPADYKAGFWVSYMLDGECITAESTEELDVFTNPRKEIKDDTLNITFQHVPRQTRKSILHFSIEVWSYNEPIMLIKHTVSNIAKAEVKDFKLYYFMDFDIGGPRSYKDDLGLYNPEKSLMAIWDETPIYVDLTSKPAPDRWEINSPVKLDITEDHRDLQNNLSLGPRDIASALQWNLGDLDVSESKSVDIALTAALSPEKAESLIPKAWKLFDKLL
jgi:hypothetical protein